MACAGIRPLIALVELRLHSTLLLLLLLSAPAVAEIPAAFSPIVVEAPFSFAQREFDLTAAFALAQTQGKPLYIYLGAADCPPCVAYTRFLASHAKELQPHFAHVVVVDVRSWLRGPKIVFKIGAQTFSFKQFLNHVGDTDRPLIWPYRWLLSPTGQAIKHLPSGRDYNYTDVQSHIEALRLP